MRHPVRHSRRSVLAPLAVGPFALASGLLAGLAGAASIGFPAHKALAADDTPPVVVELFTSQGCNSCPPAEALLAELADRDGVIALEFHVDYWDYIGWSDPFADPSYTHRQRFYNQLFGSPYNYTPQMVIDGRAHEVGSRETAVEARIEAAAMKRMMDADDGALPELNVAMDEAGGMVVTLDGPAPDGGSYRILLAGFDDRHVTEVEAGENSGRTLVNRHVVRSLTTLDAHWSGGPALHRIRADMMSGDGGCAVLIQDMDTGTIAAAQMLQF